MGSNVSGGEVSVGESISAGLSEGLSLEGLSLEGLSLEGLSSEGLSLEGESTGADVGACCGDTLPLPVQKLCVALDSNFGSPLKITSSFNVNENEPPQFSSLQRPSLFVSLISKV